ncbi:uncharacterized protein GBIM_02786 [Gryllus bimaculatus]|nr:uncharacterized protein GBIM_02786 [Gryllus bimaculatus]
MLRGGYTPAHIAMQFNHENIFSLLVEAYGADPNLRDWSGRKPRQYLANQDTAVSADTFRSEYRPRASSMAASASASASASTSSERLPDSPLVGAYLGRKSFLRRSRNVTIGYGSLRLVTFCLNCIVTKRKYVRTILNEEPHFITVEVVVKIKARKKQSEKELGFLRIGSLNMRVKRTTEAFSNFLGVGTTNSEKLHKSWGSADNIQQVDRRIMPPPKVAPIKKRGSRRGGQDYSGSHSTPSTPPSHTRTAHDSDSDTACGFGSDWQVTS